TQKIAANQPIAIDVNLRVLRPTDDVIAEIFVSDSDKFDPDKGTSGHEFLWLYQAGQTKVVLPDGKIENQTTPNRDFRTMSILIRIERDATIVSQQNKAIWSGAHGLDPSKPRYLGLRLIKTAPQK